MPHIWIEYSANMERHVEAAGLTSGMHRAAVGSGEFSVGAIRTRARRVEDFRIADGHPENSFVHVVARIAAGRDQDTKQRIGQLLFAELCRLMQPLYERTPLGLSLEVQELDAHLNFKQNNLQEYVNRRASA